MAFQNLLVPVDLEDESTWGKPLSTALEYAGFTGAKVHVITVVPNEMMKMSVVSQYITEDFEETLREDAKKKLAAAVGKHVPAGVDIQQIVRLGRISPEILETARDMEADLIVMAAHKPKFGDFMTGSTTDQVIHRASCSVWIIRD